MVTLILLTLLVMIDYNIAKDCAPFISIHPCQYHQSQKDLPDTNSSSVASSKETTPPSGRRTVLNRLVFVFHFEKQTYNVDLHTSLKFGLLRRIGRQLRLLDRVLEYKGLVIVYSLLELLMWKIRN